MKAFSFLSPLCVLTAGICLAQAPVGTIAGVVRDPSGAVVAGARVQAVSPATGQARETATSERGDYSFPALFAGEYQMSLQAPSFQRIVRAVTMETGSTTMVDFVLRIGEVTESATVEAASPQIHYDSPTVGGLTTRGQIEALPLNGRSFLELAKLEPGVLPPSRSNNNRTFVPVLGAPGGRGTRVTVDGGSVMAVGSFGSQMGFSQEVVQEFQISSVNFDLSTGTTDAGAVNLVTRSGGNALQPAGGRAGHFDGWPNQPSGSAKRSAFIIP
jgi:Carboxypeptidase regulatory-like domain